MIQPNLFTDFSQLTKEQRNNLTFPRVRKNDPITSFEAADNSDNFADKHKTMIIAALTEPLGKDGIARKAGLDPIQVSRRLLELQKQGKIELTGRKVKSNAGLSEREWQLKS